LSTFLLKNLLFCQSGEYIEYQGRRQAMAKVAFLGLGVMGFPMAGYLAKNGHAENGRRALGYLQPDPASRNKLRTIIRPIRRCTGRGAWSLTQ
jgi:hypothetical protein